MNGIDTRITKATDELERLCVRLGTIVAIQHIVGAGVDVTRALEKLDAIEPVTNKEYRQRHSVKMEHVRSVYMHEEMVTRAEIVDCRALLASLIHQKRDGDANGDEANE